eukprot:CAMPEP_0197660242 /NCGR_PEP_ID=MMETSP1338-20131121/50730_1 /TAXON_ID=43686 ORGANISM="Pelagodinium beii, Strain RCC1491" /NCGR_SAMPLE_ID=MMETSP1338 /ASSEMBLY_ACC=CAM_ASM_000754 /LENGTH=454 /DNA_ID=CAMNT_0043237561 /DNA_START=144 /DNA_END=1508 /DNA_ORIENTATION=-
MADVVVFSRSGCDYCARVKALLSARSIQFSVVDLSAQPDRRSEALEMSGSSTVPQVFVGQRCLGGFDDLQRLDQAGDLLEAVCRSEKDGASIVPTPAIAMTTASEAVSQKLLHRAEVMAKVKYQAGSRPSVRSFLRYAVTSTPAQDQSNNAALNLGAVPGDTAPPAVLPESSASELAALLRQSMLQLLDKFFHAPSGDVDYVAMQGSVEWACFRALAAELGEPRLRDDLVALSENERKAFFINLYNAMTFHGVVTFGKRPGLWYLYCFFITPAVSYRLAGVQVSLDDVEHGFLRAQPKYFQDADQELQRLLRLPEVDARIHMALNCGARGCPAVAVYSGGLELSAELDEAVVGFVADDCNVHITCDAEAVKLKLSELFKMYLQDFAGPDAKPRRPETQLALARWIAPFARGEKQELLQRVTEGGSQLKLEWLPYNWETNGTEMPLDNFIYVPSF